MTNTPEQDGKGGSPSEPEHAEELQGKHNLWLQQLFNAKKTSPPPRIEMPEPVGMSDN